MKTNSTYATEIVGVTDYVITTYQSIDNLIKKDEQLRELNITKEDKLSMYMEVQKTRERLEHLVEMRNLMKHLSIEVVLEEIRLSNAINFVESVMEYFQEIVDYQKQPGSAKTNVLAMERRKGFTPETMDKTLHDINLKSEEYDIKFNIRIWELVLEEKRVIDHLKANFHHIGSRDTCDTLLTFYNEYLEDNGKRFEEQIINKLYTPSVPGEAPIITDDSEPKQAHLFKLLTKLNEKLRDNPNLRTLINVNVNSKTTLNSNLVLNLIISDKSNKLVYEVIENITIANIIKDMIMDMKNGQKVCDDESSESGIPTQLETPLAKKVLAVAVEKGWLDNDLQPAISHNKAAILASVMADKLDLNPHWTAFEELWGITDLAKKFSKTKLSNYYNKQLKIFAKVLNSIALD